MCHLQSGTAFIYYRIIQNTLLILYNTQWRAERTQEIANPDGGDTTQRSRPVVRDRTHPRVPATLLTKKGPTLDTPR